MAGITGERDRLPEQLVDQLRWLRGQTELPICVGFGIGPEKRSTVQMLRDVADGVIVGSGIGSAVGAGHFGRCRTSSARSASWRKHCAAALNPGSGT